MSRFSEAEWTLCTYLFYTARTDVAIKYIRDRSLAVVVTAAVLAADTGALLRQDVMIYVELCHYTCFCQGKEHRVQHTRFSGSLWQRWNVGL